MGQPLHLHWARPSDDSDHSYCPGALETESKRGVKNAKDFREVDICEIFHEFRKLLPHLTYILNGKVSSKGGH